MTECAENTVDPDKNTIIIGENTIDLVENTIKVIKARPSAKAVSDFKNKLNWDVLSSSITEHIIMKYHDVSFLMDSIKWDKMDNLYRTISQDFIKFIIDNEKFHDKIDIVFTNMRISNTCSRDFITYLFDSINTISNNTHTINNVYTKIIYYDISKEFFEEILGKIDDFSTVYWQQLYEFDYFNECILKFLETSTKLSSIKWRKFFSSGISLELISSIIKNKQIFEKIGKKQYIMQYASEELIREILLEIDADDDTWKYISRNKQLSKAFIEEFQDKLYIPYIIVYSSSNISDKLMENFIIKANKGEIEITMNSYFFIRDIKSRYLINSLINNGIIVRWDDMSSDDKTSISISKFIDINRYQYRNKFKGDTEILITEDIIRNMYDKNLLSYIEWYTISTYPVLSEDFITEFMFELDTHAVAKNNKVISDDFRNTIQHIYNGVVNVSSFREDELQKVLYNIAESKYNSCGECDIE